MSTAFASVQVRTLPPKVIRSIGAEGICKMTKNCDPKKSLSGGLTKVDLIKKPRLTLASTAIKNKEPSKRLFCFEPTNIDLSFNWVKVWVASELKTATCAYRAVAEHEQKHVDIAHEVLRKYARNLALAFDKAKIPSKAKPLEIQNSKPAYDAAHKKYGAVVTQVVKAEYISKLQAIYNEIGTRWKRLDSKSEYSRVRKSCREAEWPF